MFSVPVIAIAAATLFAVAVGNVWFTLLRRDHTFSNESLQQTLSSIVAYLLFFCALAYAVPLLGTYVSFLELALIITIFAIHPYFHLSKSQEQPLRYFVMHASYTVLVVFGGLAVITYWPW